VWFPGYYRFAWWRAERAVAAGNKDKGVKILSRLATGRPRDPMAWLSLAKILIRLGERAEAEEVIRKALGLHSGSLELRSQHAQILTSMRRYEEARTAWEALRRDHPESPDAYQGLAAIAMHEGDLSAVSRLIDECLRRGPDPYLVMDTAILLAAVPEERGRAKELLLRVARAPKHRRDPIPQLLLAMLLEDSSPQESRDHMALARKYWRRRPAETLNELESRLRARLKSGIVRSEGTGHL
jgi:predicted Zn-dependent protease